jgi:hypothetical protein
MALRYRRGMAIAAGTTIVAVLIQLLMPQVSREAVDTAQGLLAGGNDRPGEGTDHPDSPTFFSTIGATRGILLFGRASWY